MADFHPVYRPYHYIVTDAPNQTQLIDYLGPRKHHTQGTDPSMFRDAESTHFIYSEVVLGLPVHLQDLPLNVHYADHRIPSPRQRKK
jgi:hypothetical protein